jgi:hypothetical protein
MAIVGTCSNWLGDFSSALRRGLLPGLASRTCAVNAAEDLSIGFHAVANDPAIAVWADRRQRVNRAFEVIECVMLASYDHLKRLIIFIFANFACSDTIPSRLGSFAAVAICSRASRDHIGK